jgi:hypothetical protein
MHIKNEYRARIINNSIAGVWIGVASWALICASALPASAQPMGGAGRGGILSPQDRAAIEDAIREPMTALRTKLQAAQRAAVQAALSEGAKEDEIKARLQAVSEVQNEMALAYWRALQKGVKFTDEQTDRMRAEPGLAYATLFGAGGPEGGRGRGGPPGGGGPGAPGGPRGEGANNWVEPDKTEPAGTHY